MENLKTKDNEKGICFYTNEKDLCKIASNHLSENIEENIEILKKLIPLKSEDIIEIKNLKILKYKP